MHVPHGPPGKGSVPLLVAARGTLGTLFLGHFWEIGAGGWHLLRWVPARAGWGEALKAKADVPGMSPGCPLPSGPAGTPAGQGAARSLVPTSWP